MAEAGGVPQHIAIIMDGNGRWAKRRNLSRAEGHRAGGEALRRVVEACQELGVQMLTVFVFSTENWKRPTREVRSLMSLIVEYVRKERAALMKNNVKVITIGNVSGLPIVTRREIEGICRKTAGNTGGILCLALNYGGRRDIVEAARDLARRAAQGEIDPADIDEASVTGELMTAGLPDPDLVIRPSGEMRISNFLLWQSAYSEFWFTPVLWPDFGREELVEAIEAYRRRDRRYGDIRSEEG